MPKCKITGTAKRKPEADGSCGECGTPDVKTTGKGFVAAHDVKVDLGDGPQIPVTDEGTRVGDPRDAAIRREVEARVSKEPVKVQYVSETRTYAHGPAEPRKDASASDPVITTGHNRGAAMYRGRAMAPVQPQRGYAASAGTMAGPIGRDRTESEEMVGGSYGYLTQSQYRALSRTQQRKYWAKITKARRVTADRRRKAAGQLPPVQAELKRLRSVGA